jgi:hypothetical protein
MSLDEILEAPFFVLSPGEVSTGLPPSEQPVVEIPASQLAARGKEPGAHLRVSSLETLDPGLVNEEDFNTAVGLLKPTFAIKEASYKLLVGRTYRGLVIDKKNQCGEPDLLAALKVLSSISGKRSRTFPSPTSSSSFAQVLSTALLDVVALRIVHYWYCP